MLLLDYNFQFPKERGGINGKCMYVDCDKKSMLHQLLNLADMYNMSRQNVLAGMYYMRLSTRKEQIKFLLRLDKIFSQDK